MITSLRPGGRPAARLQYLLIACFVTLTSGCALQSPSPDSAAANRTGVPSASANLVFFDADAFDSGLSTSLADKPGEVHVAFASPTSLNTLPPRLNTSLVEVQKSNGVVQATSTETGPDGKRALGPSIVFDVIDFLITWKERQARASQLATVHQYNAQIIYDKANGRATEITFSRRGIWPAHLRRSKMKTLPGR